MGFLYLISGFCERRLQPVARSVGCNFSPPHIRRCSRESVSTSEFFKVDPKHTTASDPPATQLPGRDLFAFTKVERSASGYAFETQFVPQKLPNFLSAFQKIIPCGISRFVAHCLKLPPLRSE